MYRMRGSTVDAPFPDYMLDCWKKFLADDAKRPAGQDLYQELYDTDLCFPLQRQREQISMVQIARRRKPKTVLEIGADKGGGLYCWAKCITSVERIIACEIRGLPYKEMFEAAFPNILWEWWPCSSDRMVLRGPIDVAFIDGDKGRMLGDFLDVRPHMSKDSVAFLHDVQDYGGPAEALSELGRHGYKTRRIVDSADYTIEMLRSTAPTPHGNWLRHWAGTSCGVGVVCVP
jgi:predicted O-methyltransferase YrrM